MESKKKKRMAFIKKINKCWQGCGGRGGKNTFLLGRKVN
jgi:hypothetical protein